MLLLLRIHSPVVGARYIVPEGLTERVCGVIMAGMIKRWLKVIIWCLVWLAVLGGSTLPPGDEEERARRFTRAIEFDYVAWTVDALALKLGQAALGTASYVPAVEHERLVIEYLELVRSIWNTEWQINAIYADPNISNPALASTALSLELAEMQERRALIEPVAEAIIQMQVGVVVAEMGLALGGQPLPPVLYHTTPPPDALIISPRDVIRQDWDISLMPDMAVDQVVALEGQVDEALDVSSLVVGIGGIGLYPTMVMQTTDINWLVEVVAHEWIHNYLTMRPVGMMYMESPELRIMNETTAEIAGKEIGREVIARFYPEYLPPPPAPPAEAPEEPASPPAEPVFDFQAEMHETRVTVDALLAEGKIEEAEAYMEQRRQFLWENGYQIRKLNQAYFAFYGAYADQPGGAAGEDPVGAAVRALRAQNATLADFINQMAWLWSYDQLREAVENGQ